MAGDVDYGVNNVTDDFADVLMKIPVVEGRWFSREDERRRGTPVVINRLAHELRRRDRGRRRSIPASARIRAGPDRRAPDVKRVVGVVEDFRQDGELGVPGTTCSTARFDPPDRRGARPNGSTSRARPGTTAAFEELSA